MAIDDDGIRSGPATSSLDRRAAVEFDSEGLVSGIAEMGLTGVRGSLSDEVLLKIDTEMRVDLLACLSCPIVLSGISNFRK